MAKNKNSRYNPLTIKEIQTAYGQRWYRHYFNQLSLIAYQMFEWKGLPDSVSPRFIETILHDYGSVGFYCNKNLGYLAVNGSAVGFDVYSQPTDFNVVSPVLTDSFKLYNYVDMPQDVENYGVLIANNDLRGATLNVLQMFAVELAKTHEVMNVNMNAQKTPFILTGDKNTIFSVKQAYNQMEANVPVMILDEGFDLNALKVLTTEAPYIVDKLNVQRLELWSQALNYLGVNSANTQKKERLITDEVQSNNDMILNSGSIMLKSRLEACELINKLFGLNVTVDFRVTHSDGITKEGVEDE